MIPGLPEKKNVVEAAFEIEQTAARHVASVTLINTGVGVSVWILVGLLGLPHPLLLGRGCVLVTLHPIRGCNGWNRANEDWFHLRNFDSVWYALLPPLAYLFCAMVEGNLATPIFLGRWLTRVGLLPLELNC